MIIRGHGTTKNISKRSIRNVPKERSLSRRSSSNEFSSIGVSMKETEEEEEPMLNNAKYMVDEEKNEARDSGRINEKNNIRVSRECAHPVPTCELCKRGYMICLFYGSCSERIREGKRENTIARRKSRSYFSSTSHVSNEANA